MTHLSAETLARFSRGELDDVALFEVLDHLDNCETCARAGQAKAADDLATLRREWSDEPVEPRAMWTYAAAAAIAVAVFTVLLLPKEPPAHVTPITKPTVPVVPTHTATDPTPRYADPVWERMIASALANGRLPFPADLAELRAPADTIRGSGGTPDAVQPSGIVVDEVRPEFRWPAREQGTYTVFIFDDDRKLIESPPLRRPRWTPARDLPRGRTLTWQVEVTGKDVFETIPSPPAPPAMFRIATQSAHDELLRARESHPYDALLLSVLYARAGMRDEALDALRRAAASDDRAKPILEHEAPGAP